MGEGTTERDFGTNRVRSTSETATSENERCYKEKKTNEGGKQGSITTLKSNRFIG